MVANNHKALGANLSLSRQLQAQGRERRKRLAESTQIAVAPHYLRNDVMPPVEFLEIPIDQLVPPSRQLRKRNLARIQKMMSLTSEFQFYGTLIIDKRHKIIDGNVRYEAAKLLGMRTLRCLKVDHLSDSQLRALQLALGRFGETAEWDLDALKVEFTELISLGVDIETTGFSIPEIDQIIVGDDAAAVEQGPLAPEDGDEPVSRVGDMFQLGAHRIICGDARSQDVLSRLMSGVGPASLVVTDVPYNVKIRNNVTRGNHREFAMASGEMSDEEFLAFNVAWMREASAHLRDGGMLGTFIDWRGLHSVATAAAELSLSQLNLIIWCKSNAGMGALYRSQHELFPLYKKGNAENVNNVRLGKNGRWRSNVWTYPGASTFGSDARKGLEDHPTVKPTLLLQDALIDLTNRGDIVIDVFAGSGSTIVASEKVGRVCHGAEIDPLYVDVIIRRYQAVTGKSAVLLETGETFDAISARRAAEGDAPESDGSS